MDEIRKVGIRQFQQNFHKELKQLPFIVTKDGQDYCVVTPLTAINDIANVLRTKHATTLVTTKERAYSFITSMGTGDEDVMYPDMDMEQDARETSRCEAPSTNCKNEGHLYQVTFMTDEGEEKKEYFLCDYHVASARKKYKVEEI